MKIVIAPDSYKGSLSASEVCTAIETGARRIFEECEVTKIPVADGGEGTVDCLLEAMNATTVFCDVKDPLGRTVQAKYGVFGDCAIMEMAQASGLPYIKEGEFDIFSQSTFGTGEMINHAISSGCKKIYIGIGGSATNDGGIGFAAALGNKFFDEDGKELEAIPANFMKISSVEIEENTETEIFVLCDVTNPLLGINGATNVFGRQKGATEHTIPVLEKGLAHYIDVVEKVTRKNVKNAKGAGAAGGLGAGLLAFTNAKMCSGVETVLELVNFEEKLKGADIVVTGEGRMDGQSAFGKVASGVAKICKQKNIPCVAVVGGMGDGAQKMYEVGISSIIPTVNGIMSIEDAVKNAEALCVGASERMFRLINLGMHVNMFTK